MQATKPIKRESSFYLYALGIMLPVMVQQLISAVFNFVDNYMVGILSAASLAGVSVANKPYGVFMCLFFGLTGAGSMLIAQYYGAQDRKTMQQIFSVQTIICMMLGFLFFVVLSVFPEQILRLFVTEEETLRAGMDYLTVIKYSYIPVSLSMSCMHAMRSIGKSRVPMIAGFLTMGVNIMLNSLLIFGLLGFPRMGEAGAALATVIARVVEALFYLYLLWKEKFFFSLDFASAKKLPKPVGKMYSQKGVPLTINEVFWSLGQMIFFWTFARVQESALPALSLVDQVTTIIYVTSAGMSAAALTIVGSTLGAGDIEGAKQKAWKLMGMAAVMGTVCTGVGAGLAFVVPSAYISLDVVQKQLATQLILVQSVCVIFAAIYSTTYSILRAGGDTKTAVMIDGGYMWIVVVPAALLCAYILPKIGRSDVRIAFVIVQLLMYAKIIWAVYIVKKGKWACNMTEETQIEEVTEEWIS